MREIRSKLTTTHTLSRKGYPRFEEEHIKGHPNSPLCRPLLWINAHTSKKKTSDANAAKIEEIKKKMIEGKSKVGEDALTQVLGKEYAGRTRALGGGATKRKISFQPQVDPVKYAKTEAKLKKVTAFLSGQFGIDIGDDDAEIGGIAPDLTKRKSSDACESVQTPIHQKSKQGSTYQPSINEKCLLLNWHGNGEHVGTGFISAVDPNAKVHGYTLGPDCYRISIEDIWVENAELYRYDPEFGSLGDAVGSTLAWPIKCIVFGDDEVDDEVDN